LVLILMQPIGNTLMKFLAVICSHKLTLLTANQFSDNSNAMFSTV